MGRIIEAGIRAEGGGSGGRIRTYDIAV